MPNSPYVDDSKAAKKAALARAKQWAETKRGSTTPPRRTPATENASPNVTPKRKTPAKDPVGHYRKTPSRESRVDALAQARSKAREWSIQQKKDKGVTGDALFEVVPETETDDVDDEVEEVWSECADNFKTADEPSNTNASANKFTTNQWQRELKFIKNDVMIVMERVQHITSENNEFAFIGNDIRSIHNRMQHLCDTAVDAEESRATGPQSDLWYVISIIVIAYFFSVMFL